MLNPMILKIEGGRGIPQLVWTMRTIRLLYTLYFRQEIHSLNRVMVFPSAAQGSGCRMLEFAAERFADDEFAHAQSPERSFSPRRISKCGRMAA